MSEHAPTLEEELANLGVTGSYIWKPNRLYAKDGSNYRSVDVVAEGSAAEIAAAVTAKGDAKEAEIEALAEAQKTLMTVSSYTYSDIKGNLRQTYQRMYNYFMNQGLIALATIMATAIVNLDNL